MMLKMNRNMAVTGVAGNELIFSLIQLKKDLQV